MEHSSCACTQSRRKTLCVHANGAGIKVVHKHILKCEGAHNTNHWTAAQCERYTQTPHAYCTYAVAHPLEQ